MKPKTKAIFLISSLIPLLSFPLITTIACANQQEQQPQIPIQIQNAIKNLNDNPPVWANSNQGVFSESELDFLSQAANKHLWIEKLSFNREQNLDYQIQPKDFDLVQGNNNNGHISYKITVSDPQTNISATTNQFKLNYQKVPFKSAALRQQKQKYNVGDLSPYFVVRTDLPVFDPSTTAFYKASATHSNIDFEKWKTTVYQNFMETVSPLKVQVLDFAIVPNRNNPQIKQIALSFQYLDETTKETWRPSTIIAGNVKTVDTVILPVNLMIWQLLYQNQIWTLNQNHDANLDENNFLANTNFDQLKDHWMVSKQINYHLIDFQNNANTISFKLQVGDDPNNQSPTLSFQL